MVPKWVTTKGRNPEYWYTVLVDTTQYVTWADFHCLWTFHIFSFFISLFSIFCLPLLLLLPHLLLLSFLFCLFLLHVRVLTSLAMDLICDSYVPFLLISRNRSKERIIFSIQYKQTKCTFSKLIYWFLILMSSKCFEPERSSSGRRLYIQLYWCIYNVPYHNCIYNCLPEIKRSALRL
jgi:hypothetical protein